MHGKQYITKKAPIKQAPLRNRHPVAISILEITLCEENGTTKTYPITVIKKARPTGLAHSRLQRDAYYIPLESKDIKYWNIDLPHKRGFFSSNLLNKELILSNGATKVTGKVIGIEAKTGGTTTPPPQKPLPPIDE